MIRPNYRDFRKSSQFVIENGQIIQHSAEGSSWKKHKYIKRVDGTYYYPDSSEDSTKNDLSEKDVENLAKEVIRGNFGNGQERKDLLGENYEEIQKRVNELMKGSAGSKPIPSDKTKAIDIAEEAAKRAVALVEADRNKTK